MLTQVVGNWPLQYLRDILKVSCTEGTNTQMPNTK